MAWNKMPVFFSGSFNSLLLPLHCRYKPWYLYGDTSAENSFWDFLQYYVGLQRLPMSWDTPPYRALKLDGGMYGKLLECFTLPGHSTLPGHCGLSLYQGPLYGHSECKTVR